MMRKLFNYSAALIILSALCFDCAAQSVSIIKDVVYRNKGAVKVDESSISVYTSAKAGDELDRQVVSRDIKTLLSTDRFSSVDALLEPVDGGLRLVYVVEARRQLTGEIAISGEDSVSESKIIKLLELLPGDFVDDEIVETRLQKVKEEYRQRYFKEVKTSYTITTATNDAALVQLSIAIDEGELYKVNQVSFSGNKNATDSELKAAVTQPAWWNPGWIFKKRRFEGFELEHDRQQIRSLYTDKGYLDVSISQPDSRKDEDGRYLIRYNIDEGIRYAIGDVTIKGIAKFQESELRKVMTIKKGGVASASRISQTEGKLEDYYGSRGYIDTTVKALFVPDPAKGILDITYVINESGLVKLRNVVIRGNTKTKDKVIRRELLVYPGDVYDSVRVRTSESRISNLGFFENIRSYPVETASPDYRDLTLEVDEKSTGRFMVGAGFSSIDKIIGYVELTQGNFDLFGWPYFTGGGQKLKLHAEYGQTRQEYSVALVEPWFLDRQLSLGVDAYHREVQYDEYDVVTTGTGIGLGKKLPGANRLDLRYSLEKNELGNDVDTNMYYTVDGEPYSFTNAEEYVMSTVGLTLTHDERNNPFLPTRGNKVSLGGTVSGGILGFDTDIYGFNLRAYQYVPTFGKQYIGLRFMYETVETYGDTAEIPTFERLYIGGGRTIRGYEYRDVGPKVYRPQYPAPGEPVYHQPIGGKSLGFASIEYSFPIVAILRFATFFDIGNVWEESFDFQADNYASSAGAGIRLDVPGFPIRFDYAKPVKKDDPYTDTQAWNIWIGYDY